MSVTIKDVAKIAGVSVATVSRVINGTKPVSEETSKRVLDAIKETNFVPNAAARSLVVKKTKMIGIVLNDITNVYFGELVKGIDATAKYFDYNIILCNSNDNEKVELDNLFLLKEKGVDGIIYTAHKYIRKEVKEFIDTCKVPIVSLNRPCKNALSIRVDNYLESLEATKYLISLGHKNIGFISGYTDDDASGQERLRGYKKGLLDNNIRFKPTMVVEGNYTVKSGYDACEKLLILNKGITAIFCANDEMAFGAINCVIDRGLNVPEDISIMGFDDIKYASYFRPKLTTVHQPIYEIGEMSTIMLIKQINKEEIMEKDVIVKGGIVVRESTGKVKI